MQKVTIEGNIAIINGEEFDLVPKKKRDYEIMEFRKFEKIAEINYKIDESGLFKNQLGIFTYTEKELLSDKNIEIHSVKYVPTGEIFSVGDKINGTKSMHERKHFYGYTWIKRFYLEDGELALDISSGTVHKNEKNNVLEGIRKYVEPLKPLFTTTDGKEIFEGDKYYCVNYLLSTFGPAIAAKTDSLNDSIKTFSTNAEAYKYVELNRKQFSKQEIINILEVLQTTGLVNIRKFKNALGI